MVDASAFVKSNETYLKVQDIKGDANDRKVVVVGEAVFSEYKARTPEETNSIKLVVPVEMKGQRVILRLNRTTNTVMVNSLGGDTEKWVGAVLLLSVAGTGKPYINVDILEKPKRS